MEIVVHSCDTFVKIKKMVKFSAFICIAILVGVLIDSGAAQPTEVCIFSP